MGVLEENLHSRQQWSTTLVEFKLVNFAQDSRSIEEYYSGFSNLWTKYTDIIYALISLNNLEAIQHVHVVTKRDQFLIKLQREFESIRSSLMNWESLPTLDGYMGKLLREEDNL